MGGLNPKGPRSAVEANSTSDDYTSKQGGNNLEGGTVDLAGDDGQPKWYDLTPLIRTQHSTVSMPQQKPKRSTPKRKASSMVPANNQRCDRRAKKSPPHPNSNGQATKAQRHTRSSTGAWSEYAEP